MEYRVKSTRYHKRMVQYRASLPPATPERIATAKRLFIKLATDHNDDEQLFEEEVNELNTYQDVLDMLTFTQWRRELGPKGRRLEYEDGKVTFRHSIFPPHSQVADLFTTLVTDQIPGFHEYDSKAPPKTGWTLREFAPDNSLYRQTFADLELEEGEEEMEDPNSDHPCLFPEDLLPEGWLMPCNTHLGVDLWASFGPIKEDTNEHPIWPSIICDMAIESEPLETLLARRDWYLSDKTGVNIWLGLKYWRDEGKWWMGLCARRSVMGCVSDVASEGQQPQWSWLAKIPGLESAEEFPSIHDRRTEIWKIPQSFLFHPISIHDVWEDLPKEFTVEVDQYRNRIINFSPHVGATLGMTGQDLKDDLIETDFEDDEDFNAREYYMHEDDEDALEEDDDEDDEVCSEDFVEYDLDDHYLSSDSSMSDEHEDEE